MKNGGQALISIDRTNKECKLLDERSAFVVRKNTGPDGLHEFYSDLGEATCRLGKVKTITIDPYAEKCGLAAALTTLCFLDQDTKKDLKQSLRDNPAIEKKLSKSQLSWIETRFRSMIYTSPNDGVDTMSAMRGAYAAGYTHVMFAVERTALRVQSSNDYIGMLLFLLLSLCKICF